MNRNLKTKFPLKLSKYAQTPVLYKFWPSESWSFRITLVAFYLLNTQRRKINLRILRKCAEHKFFRKTLFLALNGLEFLFLQTGPGTVNWWFFERNITAVSELRLSMYETLNPLGPTSLSPLGRRSLCGDPGFPSATVRARQNPTDQIQARVPCGFRSSLILNLRNRVRSLI